jgi:hypothetical protein
MLVTACLLLNEPTSCSSHARVRVWIPAPAAKASLNRANQYVAADAKPSDLSMGRMKRR